MDEKTIEALVHTTIQTSIINALNDAPEAIDALVQSALKKEVNEHGGEPSYHSSKKMPWLEWCVGEHIRLAARNAIEAAVKLREEDIKAAIYEKLNADSVVDAMIKNVLAVTEREWSLQITFADNSERTR